MKREETTELVRERFLLCRERINSIPEETAVAEQYREYFVTTASFIRMVLEAYDKVADGSYARLPIEKLQVWNRNLYGNILMPNYDRSYGNPDYASRVFGTELGQLISFLYTEVRGLIVFAFEQKVWDMTVICELFLEVYSLFEAAEQEHVQVRPAEVQKILYWYLSDYCAEMVEQRTLESLDPDRSFAMDIIREWDLSDLRYLYQYGEYVTENELQTAEFMNSLPQEKIDAMARTYTEGYRIGFEVGRKDITKKKTVNIRYQLGFERMIKTAAEQFEKMGLKPVIYRAAAHAVNKRQHIRIGFSGAVPNKQFDYDHRSDAALYLDEDFVKRKLRAMQVAYEKAKDLAAVHGGPAVVEVFGEKPFSPETKESCCQLTKKQQKLLVEYNNESGQIVNRYIRGEERSFTIIAYPVPEIGEKFSKIFRETVKINTLDYKLYQRIQQTIIEALDQGVKVHIKGKGANRTDLMIALHKLADPAKQTNFENCVADVNIPVGEVFTSPVLKGTNGTLHVSSVYLNELLYKDLEITFTNGMITSYNCGNFETEEENRAYIRENVLYHRETLPMGEFAIGTNTTAYRMAKTYEIADKLPILIAEKMGPHFAVGDTCYSWAEDTAVYNPDGREIIARDNEVSILRKEDTGKAYLGCHTDITIPYEELDSICAVKEDGTEIAIIKDGRFVLPGTEELNIPLDEPLDEEEDNLQ